MSCTTDIMPYTYRLTDKLNFRPTMDMKKTLKISTSPVHCRVWWTQIHFRHQNFHLSFIKNHSPTQVKMFMPCL